nr:hypothetical protein Iba_chr14bCG13410 [Ipomoea batatas]
MARSEEITHNEENKGQEGNCEKEPDRIGSEKGVSRCSSIRHFTVKKRRLKKLDIRMSLKHLLSKTAAGYFTTNSTILQSYVSIGGEQRLN